MPVDGRVTVTLYGAKNFELSSFMEITEMLLLCHFAVAQSSMSSD